MITATALHHWTDDEIRHYWLEDDRDTLLVECDRLSNEREGLLALAIQIESCDVRGEQWDVTDWLLLRVDGLSRQMDRLEADAEAIEDEMPQERPFLYRVL